MTKRISNQYGNFFGVDAGVYILLNLAYKRYEDHFDLFSSTYYLNNPEKRIQAAKRYALLKECEHFTRSESQARFENIFKYKLDFKKMVFMGYKCFTSITNYNYFKRILKHFRNKNVTSCTPNKNKL